MVFQFAADTDRIKKCKQELPMATEPSFAEQRMALTPAVKNADQPASDGTTTGLRTLTTARQPPRELKQERQDADPGQDTLGLVQRGRSDNALPIVLRRWLS